MQAVLKYRLLSPLAFPPRRAYSGSVGSDLRAAEDVIVPAHGGALIRTGLAIQVPRGTYARVASRSGLSVKSHLNVGAGVVDPDYTSEVCVFLFNHSSVDFLVSRGTACAQIILEKAEFPRILEDRDLYTAGASRSFWSRALNGVRAMGRPSFWSRALAWLWDMARRGFWSRGRAGGPPAGEVRGSRRFGSSDAR